MSETISHTWQTVEQAAVTMNCSTRTIARRLSNGSLESRVDENGRRLVLVQSMSAGEITPEPAENAIGQSTALSQSGSVSPSDVTRLGDPTGSMLAVLQTTINTLQTESNRAKSAAQWAWLGVGTMGMGVLAVAVLLTASLTKSSMLEKTVAETRTELKQTRSEVTTLTSANAIAEREKEQANIQLAEATARIKQAESTAAKIQVAATETPAKRPAPATRPTLFGRLASMMGDDGR